MRITVIKDYTADENGRPAPPIIDCWSDPDSHAEVDDHGRLIISGIDTSVIYAAGEWINVRIEREDVER